MTESCPPNIPDASLKNPFSPILRERFCGSFLKQKRRAGKRILPERILEAGEQPETEYFTEYEIHPEELGDAAIISQLDKIRNKALACDERVTDCSVSCAYRRHAELFLLGSGGKITIQKQQNILWMTSAMTVLAAKGEELKDYYRGYSNLGGAEVFDRMESDVAALVGGAVALLDSEPIAPGEYEWHLVRPT